MNDIADDSADFEVVELVDPSDDEPADSPDWEIRHQLTHTQNASMYDGHLDQLGVTDPFARYTVARALEMRAVSGDADPMVAEGVNEIVTNIVALFADFRKNPGKACVSAIRKIEDPAERKKAIQDSLHWLQLLLAEEIKGDDR